MKRIIFILLALISTGAVAQPSRPLIFIPGVIGSELSKDGELLWGGMWSLRNLRGLTIENGPREPTDGVLATGIVKVISILGVISLDEYAKTLYPIVKELGYREDYDFFVFPYDWRSSNFDTAKKFQQFLESPRLKGKEVDILAHSMGGLVAQIYLKQLGGGNRVRRIINLAVPFHGSVDTVRTLTDGWGTAENTVAGGLKVVRKFSLSIPSFYEMLPRYQYCCILGTKEDPTRQPYDVLNEPNWERIRWLDDYTGISKQGVHEALRRSSELRELAFKPYPSSVKVYYIVGAGIETASQFYVDKERFRISGYNRSNNQYQGDGTVLELSASNGDIAQSFVSFAQHQTIFNDNSSRTALRRILCDHCGGPLKFAFPAASALTVKGENVSVSSVGIITSQNYVGEGDTLSTRMRLSGTAGSPLDKVDISLQISRVTDKAETVIRTIPLNGYLETATSASYSTEISNLNELGVVKLNYLVKGLQTFSDFIVVIPKNEQ